MAAILSRPLKMEPFFSGMNGQLIGPWELWTCEHDCFKYLIMCMFWICNYEFQDLDTWYFVYA